MQIDRCIQDSAGKREQGKKSREQGEINGRREKGEFYGSLDYSEVRETVARGIGTDPAPKLHLNFPPNPNRKKAPRLLPTF